MPSLLILLLKYNAKRCDGVARITAASRPCKVTKRYQRQRRSSTSPLFICWSDLLFAEILRTNEKEQILSGANLWRCPKDNCADRAVQKKLSSLGDGRFVESTTADMKVLALFWPWPQLPRNTEVAVRIPISMRWAMKLRVCWLHLSACYLARNNARPLILQSAFQCERLANLQMLHQREITRIDRRRNMSQERSEIGEANNQRYKQDL